METTISADGTDVRFYDEGHGRAIVILGPGLDDGTRTKKLAAILANRFRVLRVHRRQYRLDLEPCSVAQEVDDVIAIARYVGEPVIIYGHSSGAVVALEALVASPSSFAGAVLFEPALPVNGPWTGPEVIKQMRAAIAAGKPGKAMAIFTHRAIGLPAWQARLVGGFTALIPHYRRLVPSQIDDLDAMHEVGNHLAAYAHNTVPTVLVGGGRSPERLTSVVHAVAKAMPRTETCMLHGRDHGADLKAPKEIAQVIAALADKVS
ncbi:alpha/beta fold hydrolase [Kibdelosporangium aridum]|uniref:Lysophospholipase, alpha-beta hydrolase superfamily n=1 Tax=Kibdelosporangium aridum TaxID=2030 RepID=A0A1Y5XIQ1_KIBAR|nr:alpha/beta hydrolase [Kibdelosporangium aridum]SMC90749.1 Lysophospholipase, alpha-beta hydrolase superfamily [Kibdelosporangium aridum]